MDAERSDKPKVDRLTGFYYVRYKNTMPWGIANWRSDLGCFCVIGSRCTFTDAALEVGDRVQMPDDKCAEEVSRQQDERQARQAQLGKSRHLYKELAEIHAVVQAVVEIALRYKNEGGRFEELLDNLIEFFGQYDAARTQHVQELERRLTEALQWSVKPMERK